MEFIKEHAGDLIFFAVAIMLCLNIDWSWSNFKSFVTGGVLVFSICNRYFKNA